MFTRRKMISRRFHGSRCASWQVSKKAMDCLWERRKPRSSRAIQSPVRLQSGDVIGMHGLQDMYRPDGISASRLTPLLQAFCGYCRSGVSREAHEPSNHRFDCDPVMIGMHGLLDMCRPDGISASRLTPLPQAFCGSCRSGVSREAHEPSNHYVDCNPEMRLACADCRTYVGLMRCRLRGLRRSYKPFRQNFSQPVRACNSRPIKPPTRVPL